LFNLLCKALNTENPSTLFRGNSVGSKLLSRYTLQQGEIYLKQVLTPLFKKASSCSALELELNPEKERTKSFVVVFYLFHFFGFKQGGSPQAAAKLTELCECVISSSERFVIFVDCLALCCLKQG
jgi:hypothetical protein